MHEGLPDIGFRWPDPYFGVPESERATRVWGTADACVIDDEDFFIRGIILIPIRDEPLKFGIGVWVSQKRENFETYMDTWALKTMARFEGNGKRPLIDLEPSDHPLFVDYSSGITLDRAWSFVHSKGVGNDPRNSRRVAA